MSIIKTNKKSITKLLSILLNIGLRRFLIVKNIFGLQTKLLQKILFSKKCENKKKYFFQPLKNKFSSAKNKYFDTS